MPTIEFDDEASLARALYGAAVNVVIGRANTADIWGGVDSEVSSFCSLFFF